VQSVGEELLALVHAKAAQLRKARIGDEPVVAQRKVLAKQPRHEAKGSVADGLRAAVRSETRSSGEGRPQSVCRNALLQCIRAEGVAAPALVVRVIDIAQLVRDTRGGSPGGTPKLNGRVHDYCAEREALENFSYSDPVYQHYEPWLEFTQADEKSRTLEYCTIYNNGVAKDGSPDVAMVTRKSHMPPQVTCTPVACVKGKVAAACKTDSDCDSAPGAKDGACDACPITGGPTTENEMFVMMPWYVLPAGTKK
jgi:hypothetical protein